MMKNIKFSSKFIKLTALLIFLKKYKIIFGITSESKNKYWWKNKTKLLFLHIFLGKRKKNSKKKKNYIFIANLMSFPVMVFLPV